MPNEEHITPVPFSTLRMIGHQESRENVFLRRNASLGCLLSLEESHEKFHSSIQNWSFANEGFVKSLVSFGDNQPRSSVSHMSNESLMSSLIGGDSILDEPHYMEQTSLMDIEPSYQVRILSAIPTMQCNAMFTFVRLKIEKIEVAPT